MPVELETVRLDKWLWAARFFKTRKLASDAISGGKVHLSNQRTKPGKEIKAGAILSISKDSFRWDITVTAISGQRRSASEAVLLYQETPESAAKRHQQVIEQRERRELFAIDGTERKPNKKERRMIHRFKQG